MIVLGINNMHDAAAALVIDGKVISAVEEERFTRKKHHVGFPANAIRHCLESAGLTIKDVDLVGVGWKPWVLGTRILNAIRALPYSVEAFKAKASRGMGQMGHEWYELFAMRRMLEKHFGEGHFKLHYVDHHLCHAVSAFFVSPFERAAILTVDGAGEAETTVMWVGAGRKIRRLKSIKLPHSLGQFYAAVTGFLGFKMQADEYKVMGMASYGDPHFAGLFRQDVIRVCEDGGFKINPYFIDYHLARRGVFLEDTVKRLGKNRRPDEAIAQQHMDIARSAQVVLEEVLFHLVNHLYRETKLDALCLAGGVAFNCVANGKLFDNTPFSRIFVQPAAGDAGTALGAAIALDAWHSQEARNYEMEAYLGPCFSQGECIEALKQAGLSWKEMAEDDLCARVASSLAGGELVCWFQGRMEWGPRALGNRSLLADPRRAEMKDIINLKVKQREPFRPFAPSVLEERGYEYFGNPNPSPFMLFAFPVNPFRRKEIPAVVHVDGTARPQTVSKEANLRYWKLLKEFEKQTAVPVLLNTSFNVQEPIVCTPEEATACFLKTKVDHLVLNNLLVENPSVELRHG